MGYHSAQLVNWKGAIETTYIYLNMHSPIKYNRISFFFLHGTYKLGRALEQTWLQVHNWTENKGGKIELQRDFTRGYGDYVAECMLTIAQIPQQHDAITHRRQECYGSMRQVWHLHTNLILLLSRSSLRVWN